MWSWAEWLADGAGCLTGRDIARHFLPDDLPVIAGLIAETIFIVTRGRNVVTLISPGPAAPRHPDRRFHFHVLRENTSGHRSRNGAEADQVSRRPDHFLL